MTLSVAPCVAKLLQGAVGGESDNRPPPVTATIVSDSRGSRVEPTGKRGGTPAVEGGAEQRAVNGRTAIN